MQRKDIELTEYRESRKKRCKVDEFVTLLTGCEIKGMRPIFKSKILKADHGKCGHNLGVDRVLNTLND